MTLRQQFSLATSGLILVLLVGTLILAIYSGKGHYQDQLNASAYDAATTLALSMSNSSTDAERERQIDVLFDRGFYREIKFDGTSGQQIKRVAESALANPAPSWFVSLIDFEVFPSMADVTDGWRRLGTISVTSHTDFAYRGMWDLAKVEVLWFAIVLLIALWLINLLIGWLFKPVEGVEKQAIAICERKWITQSDLPKVRELRNMVLAMNRMVEKVHKMFSEQAKATENLRQESFTDDVTGLLNRRGFDQKLEHILTSEEEHSHLLIVFHIDDFALYNQNYGRIPADKLLVDISILIKKWITEYSGGLIGRHSGADFAILVASSGQGFANDLTENLFNYISSVLLPAKRNINFYIGSAQLASSDDTIAQAFSKADVALKNAQRNPSSDFSVYFDVSGSNCEYTATEWQEILLKAVEEKSIRLAYMPLIVDGEGVVSYEVYSKLMHENESISASRFWPMVEYHGLAPKFDLMVVDRILSEIGLISQNRNIRFSINISPSSLKSQDFLNSLEKLIENNLDGFKGVAFELPEYILDDMEGDIDVFSGMLKRWGILFGVDQVGSGGIPFSYMKRLSPDYLKIDGSLNRGISSAADTRFFSQFLIQMGHQLDINVYADGVESDADKETLISMSVDGISGYVHGVAKDCLE